MGHKKSLIINDESTFSKFLLENLNELDLESCSKNSASDIQWGDYKLLFLPFKSDGEKNDNALIGEILEKKLEAEIILYSDVELEGNLVFPWGEEKNFILFDKTIPAFLIQQWCECLLEKNKKFEQVEKKVREAQQQLLQADKMASIGQLAAGVAHEINNPVGFINSNISSLKKYIEDLFLLTDVYEKEEKFLCDKNDSLKRINEAKESIDVVFLREDIFSLLSESTEGVSRVKKIVQDLKDFSHVDDAEWQWVNIHRGIDSTINIVHNETKYKAKVIKDYDENLPDVECMGSQLNQVFLNVLVNASHAIEKEGTITIKTSFDEKNVTISITDTGCGIDPDKIKKIFDPFFTTKPVGTGTGLGLSLSYGIIQKHQGKIHVESELGKGTNFSIILPIKQEEDLEKNQHES